MKHIYTGKRNTFFKLAMLVMVMGMGVKGWGQATLPITRTAWANASQPTGWTNNAGVNRTTTFACSGSNGGSLQTTGSYYRVFFNSSPGALTYTIKGGTASIGTFKVQESVDGIAWTDVVTINTLSSTNTCISQNNTLNSASRYVQFIHVLRSANIDIDDVNIAASAAAAPEINLQGNATDITNGDNTPRTADDTDFGAIAVATGSISKTFTIQNTGNANLNLTSSSPYVTISGTNAADFSISAAPSTPVSGVGSTTFTVLFDPSALGLRTAIINIANNDADEGTYTFAIQGTGVNSSSSDIISATDISTSNINYTLFQANPVNTAANSVGAYKFTIRDGAAGVDADNLGTELTSITFTVTNIANIRSAGLFGGGSQTTYITSTPTINVGAGTITFTGLSNALLNAGDGAAIDVTLRVSFLTTVIDRQQLQYTISSATANTAGSVFASSNAGAATSSITGDRNKIQVLADRLTFGQQPSSTSINTSMTPAVTVRGVDVNNNLDLEYVGAIAITSTGTLTGSPVNATASAGIATYATLTHTAAGTGFVLTATTSGLAFANTIGSTTFDINTAASGTYRTTSAGTWPTSGTATWERFNGSTWAAATPAASSTDLLIIRHAITTNGAFAAPAPGTKMTVENNGNFIAGHNSTFATLLVNTGGIFSVNVPGVTTNASSGTITVETGGSFILNSSTLNHVDGLFDGTENFKTGSIVEVQKYDNDSSPGEDDLIETLNPISTNAAGYYFGNLVINFTNENAKAFTLVGITGTQKLCENDLTIANQTATELIQITNVNANVEVGGNVIVTQNRFSFGSVTAFNIIHTVNGSITVNGASAIIDLNATNSGTSSVTVNVKGNLIGTQGTFTSTDGGCAYSFNGTTLQNIDVTTTVPYNNCGTIIRNAANVQLLNNNLTLNSGSTFRVEAGGTFNFNWNSSNTPLLINNGASGTNKFDTEAGSILKITSSLGLVKTVANSGNVQLSVSNKTFDDQGTFWYTGKTNQLTGDAVTTGSAVGSAKTIICDLLDNSKELTFTNSTSISTGGNLDIRVGRVIETTTALVTGAGGNLKMAAGTYYKIPKGYADKLTSNNNTNYIPRLDGTYTINGGTIELSGAGATDGFQTLRGARAYANLSFTSGGLKNVSTGITGANYIKGTVLVSDATVLDVENNTFGDATIPSGNATNLTMTGTAQYLTAGAGPKPDAVGIYSLAPATTIEFKGISATVIRLGLTSINYANIIVSGTNVSNTSTSTGIQFQTGGTFIVKTGAIFNLANASGFTGATSTAVSNLNTPSVTLETGSTINYNGAAQTITNTALTSPATANYYNLTLSGTGIKTAPSSNLTLLGDLFRAAGAHTFEANTGRVIFNAAVAQKYYGPAINVIDFYNLTNNNTSATGLSIDANMGVLNELQLNTTNKITLNTGDIIIRSSATKTGYISDLGVSGTGNTAANILYNSGRFFVERYLQKYLAWRFIATPFVADATLTVKNSWQETGLTTTGYGTQITGPTGIPGGFDQASPRASLKYFEGSGSPDGGFVDVVNTITTPLINKEGYFVFVRGDRTVANGGTTGATNMRIKGKIISGDQTYTVAANRFLSVGNPYASQIDFKQVTTILPAGIEGSYTVWNPNPVGTAYNAGKYEQRVRQVGGDYTYLSVVQNYIESGQGFLIQGSNGGGGSITIKEAYKTTGSNLASRGGEQGRAGVTIPTLEINLYSKDVNGSFIKADVAFQNYDNGFNAGIDNSDVRKVMNVSDNISIAKSNLKLIAERRKPLEATDTIHINLSNTREAAYQFLIDPSVLGNLELEAFLQDKFLQTSTAVSLVDSTLINFSITNNVASKAADRFMIVFKQTATTNFTTIAAKRNIDKTISVNWGVANEKNVNNYVVEQSKDGVNFSTIHTQIALANNGSNLAYTKQDDNASEAINWYRIKLINTNSSTSYSSIAMVSAVEKVTININPSITILPNIIVDGKINLKWTNKANGNYAVKIYNAQGQLVKIANIKIQNNNTFQLIQLGNISKGKYILIAEDEAAEKTTLDFIVE